MTEGLLRSPNGKLKIENGELKIIGYGSVFIVAGNSPRGTKETLRFLASSAQ